MSMVYETSKYKFNELTPCMSLHAEEVIASKTKKQITEQKSSNVNLIFYFKSTQWNLHDVPLYNVNEIEKTALPAKTNEDPWVVGNLWHTIGA